MYEGEYWDHVYSVEPVQIREDERTDDHITLHRGFDRAGPRISAQSEDASAAVVRM